MSCGMNQTTIDPPRSKSRIDLGYRARPQFIPFHARRQRWACLVAHRRAGKTVACVMDLVDAALRSTRPRPRYAYVAPFYAQAKDVAWTYLKQYTAPIPGASANEAELRVDIGDRRIRLYGADNYDRLRGIYLDGIVLDEYADMDPRAWGEVIRPALSDRKGWAVFIGTPKGRNAFHDMSETAHRSPDWFHAILRASQTGLIDTIELSDARRAMTPEQYAQEYECSFDAAIVGSYYGTLIADAEAQDRIGVVNHDPEFPVHTAWDLGIGDSTSIWWWQVAADGVRVVDYYEAHGQPLGHYASVIASKPYSRGDDYVPHDARVRELGTGRTRLETMLSLNLRPRIVVNHKIDDGINAVRQSFPRIWIDAARCKFGLEALRQYRTDYDEKLKVFKSVPKHDWTSHAADAFRYMAMAWREMQPAAKPTHPIKALLRRRTMSELLEEADADAE